MVNLAIARRLGALWRVWTWSRELLSQLIFADGVAPTVRRGPTTSARRDIHTGRAPSIENDGIRPSLRPQPSVFGSTVRLRSGFSTVSSLHQLDELRAISSDEPPPVPVSYPAIPRVSSPLSPVPPISFFPEVGENSQDASIVPPPRPEIPSHVPLTYKIRSDVRCKLNPETAAPEPTYWRHTLYRGPKGEHVALHYCHNTDVTERVAKLFLDDRVLGFDMEWKAQASTTDGIKKNVALIQLANEARVGLFHVALFEEPEEAHLLMTPTLKRILESAEITKVGIAIKNDCTRLRKFLGLDPRGLFELSHLHRLVKYAVDEPGKVNRQLVSLADQIEEHFGLAIWKGDDVRSSDWTKPLNEQQMQYAASDAYAVLQLYDVLEAKRRHMDPTPPHPTHAELNLPIRLVEEHVTVSTTTTATSKRTVASATTKVVEDVEDDDSDTTTMSAELEISTSPPSSSGSSSSAETTSVSLSRTTTRKGPSSTDPDVQMADAWAIEYQHSSSFDPDPDPTRNSSHDLSTKASNRAVPRAPRAQLRAYALWHSRGRDVDDIARLLRDPPLQRSTVAMYIVEAIRIEKLKYDVARLRAVLGYLPAARKRRYLYMLYSS